MSAKLERMLRKELQINIVLHTPCGILSNFYVVVFCPVGSYCVILSVRNMSCRIMSGYCTVFYKIKICFKRLFLFSIIQSHNSTKWSNITVIFLSIV